MTDVHVVPGPTRQISLRRELATLPVAPGLPPERRRRDDGWLDRWLDTCSDLARLQATNPMLDAVIDEIDGREIRIGDHWLSDFASCNYLGLDLDAGVISAVPAYLERWGTHPSWSRLRTPWSCRPSPTSTCRSSPSSPVRARSSSTDARTRRSTTAASWPARTAPRWSASRTTTSARSRRCCATTPSGRR